MPFSKLNTLVFPRILNALNDNLFKTTLLTLIAVRITQQTADPSNIVAGLLILPFFLFSARAGQLAKKYNRTKLTRSLKLMDLALMLLAGGVLFTKNIGLLILLPFLFGALSAFFGPMRYAFQPDQLEDSDLSAGNAYIEKSTYASIILALLFGVLLPALMKGANTLLMTFIVCAYVAF